MRLECSTVTSFDFHAHASTEPSQVCRHAWLRRRRKLEFGITVQKRDSYFFAWSFTIQVFLATSQTSLACRGMCVWRSLPYCGVIFGSFGFLSSVTPISTMCGTWPHARSIIPEQVTLPTTIWAYYVTANWLCQLVGDQCTSAVLIFCLVS